MNPRNSEQSLFLHAIGLETPGERAAYLEDACRENPALRADLEALLAAHDRLGAMPRPPDPTETATAPAGDATPTAVYETPTAATGTVIAGRYKLLEEIGEGGMGTVWMAEQTTPVQRMVAVKLVRAGMDSRHVMARFEAERQALALMDHPNIARVLDGGVAPDGRPFFVMELVKGTPITRFCDAARLPVRDRLALFADVCHAVQHAHQKGIIHRDLKPSNILVAPFDGRPMVKVIDFGVAKATGQKLTEKTLFTGFGAVVGTPEYMSPEQAEVNNRDIDTRSDVYALGVLLYELLTGSTPLTRQRLRNGILLEILLLVREEEPPRPSVRLSSTDELPSIAAVRGVEPAKLSRLVRGELDWIAMKALEKDRSRRYETANGLAADIGRYLADEPVQACPPSAGYRMRKFARRNRTRLVVAGMLAVAALVATSGVGYAVRDRSARQAEAERDRKEREAEVAREKAAREAEITRQSDRRRAERTAEVDVFLRQIAAAEGNGEWYSALALARQMEVAVRSGEADPVSVSRAEQHLRVLVLIDRLETFWLDTYGEQGDRATVLEERDRKYEEAFAAAGLYPTRETAAAAAARVREECPPDTHGPIAHGLMRWADARFYVRGGDEGDGADAWALLDLADLIDGDPVRTALRGWMRAGESDPEEVRKLLDSPLLERAPAGTVVGIIDQVVTHRGRAEAIRLLQRTYLRDPANRWVNSALLRQYAAGGPEDSSQVLAYCRANLALTPERAKVWDDLGVPLLALGRQEEAIQCHRKAIELDPNYVPAYIRLAIVLFRSGQRDEAIRMCQQGIEMQFSFTPGHYHFGKALWEAGRKAEAVAELQTAACLDPDYYEPRRDLGLVLPTVGQRGEAIRYAREAVRCAKFRDEAAGAHGDLGTLLAEEGRHADAIPHLRKAWELNPKDFRLGWNLHHALALAGRLKASLEQLREVVSRHPTNATMLNNLAWQLVTVPDIALRDPKEALNLARRAVRQTPSADHLGTLSVAALRAGDPHDALRARQERMASTNGGDCRDQFWLTSIYAALDRPTDARRAYDRALRDLESVLDPGDDLKMLQLEAKAALARIEKRGK